MGITYVEAQVSNIAGKHKGRDVRFLVDSGAIYSVLPQDDWKPLGLKSMRSLEFTLADGTLVKREVSECRFTVNGLSGVSPVILGLPDDVALLGAVTLEVLGLILNPFTRKLNPMKMMLM